MIMMETLSTEYTKTTILLLNLTHPRTSEYIKNGENQIKTNLNLTSAPFNMFATHMSMRITAQAQKQRRYSEKLRELCGFSKEC